MKEARPLLGGEIRLPRRVLVFRESFTFALGPDVARQRISHALESNDGNYQMIVNEAQPLLTFTAGSRLGNLSSQSPAGWLHYLEVAFTEASDGLIEITLNLYVDPTGQTVLKKEKLYWDRFLAYVKDSILTGSFDIKELETVRKRAERQNFWISAWHVTVIVIMIILFVTLNIILPERELTGWQGLANVTLLCLPGFIVLLLPILWARYFDKG